jgi:hypothetical protein
MLHEQKTSRCLEFILYIEMKYYQNLFFFLAVL